MFLTINTSNQVRAFKFWCYCTATILAEFQHSRIKSELEWFQLISGTQYNDKIRMYDTQYENKNIEFLKL